MAEAVVTAIRLVVLCLLVCQPHLPRRRKTRGWFIPVRSITMLVREDYTPYTRSPRRCGLSGRRNLKRQSVYERSYRSPTRSLRWKPSVQIHSSYRPCLRPQRITRGTTRTPSPARLHVPSPSVCPLFNVTYMSTAHTFHSATADGRALVAVGCAEGVWIGFRHDSRCMFSVWFSCPA